MDLASLPADTAHRFRIVTELLVEHGKSLSSQPQLLDVGGHPGTFARAFTSSYPRWRSVTLDRPEDNLPDYVSATGTKIPFNDNSFDAVVSIDTLEHIPSDERQRFINELCRVSSGLVIVAAPFHHAATAAVERILNSLHETIFKAPHPWLDEHVRYGLPNMNDVREIWPASHPIVDIRGSYALQAWTNWQALSLARKLRSDLDNNWKSFDAASAQAGIPDQEPLYYRWIVVANKNGVAQDLPSSIIPPDGVGQEVVELARFYRRMIELMAEDQKAVAQQGNGANVVELRLKEAIIAMENEIEILRGKVALSGDAIPRPNTKSSMLNPIRGLFGRS